jgi:endonuclease/exonuclease/phosphatase family metal-dependent hydrolase
MRIQGERRQLLAAAVVVVGCLLAGTACSSDASDGGSSGRGTGDPGAGTTEASAPAKGEGGELTLLTYNVAGLPQELSKENPKEHLPLISPLLNDYDVVLTQEDFDWYGELAKGLDVVNYHGRLRKDATHEFRSPAHPGLDAVDLDPVRKDEVEIGDGLGVLSRFPIEGNVREPWKGCFGGVDTSDGGAADCLAMKGFALTRITLAKGVVVDVYNLHNEAGGGPKDQAVQGDDVRQLADYIEENSRGHAVIVAGDTNLHTDRVHPDADDGADIELWDHLLDTTGLTDACAATDCPDTGRIDKVAYRSAGGVELEATSYDVPAERFKDAKGDDLSDHEPVVVGLRWRRA